MRELLIFISILSFIYYGELVEVKFVNEDEKVIQFVKIDQGIIYYYPNNCIGRF